MVNHFPEPINLLLVLKLNKSLLEISVVSFAFIKLSKLYPKSMIASQKISKKYVMNNDHYHRTTGERDIGVSL